MHLPVHSRVRAPSSQGLRIVDVVYEKDPADLVKNPRLDFKSEVRMWDATTGKLVDLPAKSVTFNDYRFGCIAPEIGRAHV